MGAWLATGVSFAVVLAVGAWAVPALGRFGQPIRDDAPARHQQKAGTATMGGVLVLAGVLAGTFAAGATRAAALPLLLGAGFGLIGLADDLLKIRRGRNLGLRGREKFSALAILSLAAGAYVAASPGLGPAVSVPGTALSLALGWGYLVFAVVLGDGFANAVNLTDGLDGLAAGSTVITGAAYAVVSLWRGQAGVAALCAATAGACLAFLWYNRHPARVIMGDVGSLAIGGILVGSAMATKTELLLVVLGAVYVVEALSVMVQVAYFRLTGGRRIFRMSPLHHHFELGGWAETTVVRRFWAAAAIAGVVGVALAGR